MTENYDFSFKSKRKNKIRLRCQFPSHIAELMTIFQIDVTEPQNKKIKDFIDRYNIVWLKEIWQSANEADKSTLFKQLSFKVADQNEIIASFKHKKPIKQILVLLDGTVGYKFNFCSRQELCHHPSRPGQVLLQPFSFDLQFKQFQLVSTTQSLFMVIPFDTSLAQDILRIKYEKLSLMLGSLSNYNQTSQEPQNIQGLSPFFSEAFYKRGQIIYSKNSKNDFLSYIISGQIQIQKESKIGQTINIVQMTKGRFFCFKKSLEESQNIQVRCKSFDCKIYMIPFPILEEISPPITKLNLLQQAKISQSLHSKMFKKNQKILINPLRLVKKRKKKKSNSKKSSMSIGQPWDLIGYMANQMKINMKTAPQILRHTKSAHVSKRSLDKISYTNSIQRLKFKSHKQEGDEKQTVPERKSHNNILRSKSNFLSTIPRTIQTKVTKQSKITLMKKTKYKLLRYAKGENLYGVSDYL